MTTPTLRAKGAFASSGNALSVSPPASNVVGNLMLLFVETAAESTFTPSGWQAIANADRWNPADTGGIFYGPQTGSAGLAGGVMLSVFAKAVTTTTEPAVTIADSGNHQAAIILEFSGVDVTELSASFTTGTRKFAGVHPGDIKVDSTGTTSMSWPGIVTDRNNCLIIHVAAMDTDAASTATCTGYTNANLTSLTERHDQTIATGVGGGLVIATGIQTTAGWTGNTTATGSTAVTHVYMTLALHPIREAAVPVGKHGFSGPSGHGSTADAAYYCGSNPTGTSNQRSGGTIETVFSTDTRSVIQAFAYAYDPRSVGWSSREYGYCVKETLSINSQLAFRFDTKSYRVAGYAPTSACTPAGNTPAYSYLGIGYYKANNATETLATISLVAVQNGASSAHNLDTSIYTGITPDVKPLLTASDTVGTAITMPSAAIWYGAVADNVAAYFHLYGSTSTAKLTHATQTAASYTALPVAAYNTFGASSFSKGYLLGSDQTITWATGSFANLGSPPASNLQTMGAMQRYGKNTYWDSTAPTLSIQNVGPTPVVETPAAGSLASTGQTPSVVRAFVVSPAAGSLASTGQTPTDVIAVIVQPAAGSLVSTGQTPTVQNQQGPVVAAPATGSLTATGQAPAKSVDIPITPTAGTLTATGQTPTVLRQVYANPPTMTLDAFVPTTPTISTSKVDPTYYSKAPPTMALDAFVPTVRFLDGVFKPAEANLTIVGQTPTVVTGQSPFVLTPNVGSSAFTGQAPTITVSGATAKTISVTEGSLTATGQSLSLTSNYLFYPAAGTLSATGQTPLKIANAIFLPSQGALAFTGYAPTSITGFNFYPSAGTLTFTGQTPAKIANALFYPSVGSLTATGQTPNAIQTYTITPTAGSLTATGYAPAGAGTLVATPAAGNLTATGQVPTVLGTTLIQPGAGALTVTGQTPTRVTAHIATPGAGSLTTAGQTPTISFITPYSFTPTAGSLTLTGQTPVLYGTATYPIGVGALATTGQVPNATIAYNISTGNSTATITGQTPIRAIGYNSLPAVGSLTFNGQSVTPNVSYKFVITEGVASVTGQAPTKVLNWIALPAAGATTATGQTPARSIGYNVFPDYGTLTISAQLPAYKVAYQITPSTGAAAFTSSVFNILTTDLRSFIVGIWLRDAPTTLYARNTTQVTWVRIEVNTLSAGGGARQLFVRNESTTLWTRQVNTTLFVRDEQVDILVNH